MLLLRGALSAGPCEASLRARPERRTQTSDASDEETGMCCHHTGVSATLGLTTSAVPEAFTPEGGLFVAAEEPHLVPV